jgi:hypothetical protein
MPPELNEIVQEYAVPSGEKRLHWRSWGRPDSLAVSKDEVFLGFNLNKVIRVFDKKSDSETPLRVFLSPVAPSMMAVAGSYLFVCESGPGNGRPIYVLLASNGTFFDCWDMAIDIACFAVDLNRLYIMESISNTWSLWRVNYDGHMSCLIDLWSGPAEMLPWKAVAVDHKHVYVTAPYTGPTNNLLRRCEKRFFRNRTEIDTGLLNPVAIATHDRGKNLYVCHWFTSVVTELDKSSGRVVRQFEGQMVAPTQVAVDENYLWVVDEQGLHCFVL